MEFLEESLLLLLLLKRKRRRLQALRRTTWVKKWIQRRSQQGAYANLVQELDAEEPEKFRQFHRLDRDRFNDILARIEPHITKKDTDMRVSHQCERETIYHLAISCNR